MEVICNSDLVRKANISECANKIGVSDSVITEIMDELVIKML